MNNEDLLYDMESSSVGTSLNTTRAPSPVIVDEPLIQPKVEPKIITTTSHSPQTTTGRTATGRAKRPPKRFDDWLRLTWNINCKSCHFLKPLLEEFLIENIHIQSYWSMFMLVLFTQAKYQNRPKNAKHTSKFWIYGVKMLGKSVDSRKNKFLLCPFL